MSARHQLIADDARIGTEAPTTLTERLRSFGRRVVKWADACADHYAAAAMYEHLSRLSDAELRRRGLSRATLGRDIHAAFDPVSNK
jgi:hypothetical protein